MKKYVAVIAYNYADYLHWCMENNIKVFHGDHFFVSCPRVLRGVEIHRVERIGRYKQRGDLAEIEMVLQSRMVAR